MTIYSKWKKKSFSSCTYFVDFETSFYFLSETFPITVNQLLLALNHYHCVKSVRMRSFPDPYFVSLRIQFEYGKIRTRKALNTDTFYTVHVLMTIHNKDIGHTYSIC